MNRNDFETLRTIKADEPRLSAAELMIGSDGHTLGYGYTCARHTWHCYLRDRQLHVVIYDISETVLSYTSGPWLPCEMLRPDKRVYPERTDMMFAMLMAHAGYPLPFLPFTDEGYDRACGNRYHGKVVTADGTLATVRDESD